MPAIALLAGSALIASCAGSPRERTDTGVLDVVATTSIVADVVRGVVGELAAVSVLIDVGADPHTYEPAPSDLAGLADADLVISVGFGLEGVLGAALEDRDADGAPVVELAESLGLEPPDPHFWLDPTQMIDAAAVVADAVATLDPSNRDVYDTQAKRYQDALRELDAEVATLIAGLSPSQRSLVTNHDALGYFASRYGLTIVGTVTSGGATTSSPSASHLANLVTEMRAGRIGVIVIEAGKSASLAEAVAAELAPDVEIIEAYIGTLGLPGSDAASYLATMRLNATRIVDALERSGA